MLGFLLEWARSNDGRAVAGWAAILMSAGLWWWVEGSLGDIDRRITSMESRFVRTELYARDVSNLDERFERMEALQAQYRADTVEGFKRMEAAQAANRSEILRGLERIQDQMARVLERDRDPIGSPPGSPRITPPLRLPETSLPAKPMGRHTVPALVPLRDR